MISTRFKDLRRDAWVLARFWAGAPSATPQKPASGGQVPSGADLSVAEPKGTDGRRGSMAVDVEQVVRNAYQVAERRDVPGWVSLFADDGVFIDESIGVTYKGPNELGKTVEVYGTAFPDMHRELYDFWTDGNTVIVRFIGATVPQSINRRGRRCSEAGCASRPSPVTRIGAGHRAAVS